MQCPIIACNGSQTCSRFGTDEKGRSGIAQWLCWFGLNAGPLRGSQPERGALWPSEAAAGARQSGRVGADAVVHERGEKVLRATTNSAGRADLQVEVGCAGSAGVPARDQQRPGIDSRTVGDVEVTAVTVCPSGAVCVVDDGHADAAFGAAVASSLGTTLFPPVVWPRRDAGDGPAPDRIDRYAGRDDPVPCRVGVVRVVDLADRLDEQ